MSLFVCFFSLLYKWDTGGYTIIKKWYTKSIYIGIQSCYLYKVYIRYIV